MKLINLFVIYIKYINAENNLKFQECISLIFLFVIFVFWKAYIWEAEFYEIRYIFCFFSCQLVLRLVSWLWLKKTPNLILSLCWPK